jgi:hypothetical protein
MRTLGESSQSWPTGQPRTRNVAEGRRGERAAQLHHVVKIFKCVEESQSSMMDVGDEHNRMRAAFGLRDRIGQPGTPAAE